MTARGEKIREKVRIVEVGTDYEHVERLRRRPLGHAIREWLGGNARQPHDKACARTVSIIELDHAAVIAALAAVDGVCIFPGQTATEFLAAAQPDIYIKGGDYTTESLNKDERRVVEASGGKIMIIPFIEGKSTSVLLKKMSDW